MYKSLRQQTLHYFARPHESICRSPITGPAAWMGKDLREPTDWQDRLSADDAAELKSAVAAAKATGKPLGKLSRADFPLPTLSERIATWRSDIRHGRGFVLVRGLPVADWTEQESEIAYWCLGQHLGLPGAQNPQADLLGHVRDQQTGEDVRLYRSPMNLRTMLFDSRKT